MQGVRTVKHLAKMQEWSKRIQDCRSSGKTVKDWCQENMIGAKTYYYWERQLVGKALENLPDTVKNQSGALVQIHPESLTDQEKKFSDKIIIRQDNTVIELPAGTDVESIAKLVRVLNCRA